MSWARRSNSVYTAALRSLSGKPVVREAGCAKGQPWRLSGKPGPGAEHRDRSATLREYRSGRGDAPPTAPCAMSLISVATGRTQDGRRPPRTLRYLADDLATAGRRAGLSWREDRGGSGLVHPCHSRIAGCKQSLRSMCRERKSRRRSLRPLPERQAAAAAFGRQPQEMHRGLHAVEAALRRPVQGVGWPIKTHQDHPPRPPSGGRGRSLRRSPRTRRRTSRHRPSGGVPTVRNLLKPREKNLAPCFTRGR